MRSFCSLYLALTLAADPHAPHIGVVAADGDSYAISITLTNGYLDDGTHIGIYTSQIQKHVIEARFPPVTSDQLAAPIHNAKTTLRYLLLKGNSYIADAPLELPSCFVLEFAEGASLRVAPNISFGLDTPPRFAALISLNKTNFSAVIGGTINASQGSSDRGANVQAISIVNSRHNVVKGVRAFSAGGGAIVGINGGSMNEVAWNELGGGSTPVRCVWSLSTSRAYVHNNHIHHCDKHALDFDAFTSDSVAASNLCEDNAQEGIFVEETASGNFVFNNTCRRNLNGIGVYSNVVGPVTHNVIAFNKVSGNARNGITAGGVGHNPKKMSKENVFLGNDAGDGVFTLAHGSIGGDYWTGNFAGGGYSSVPATAAGAAVFDPVRMLSSSSSSGMGIFE